MDLAAPSPPPLDEATDGSCVDATGDDDGVGSCAQRAQGGGVSSAGSIGAPASAQWALTSSEDLQFACYQSGGFYRRHSDGQNASRRVLTAIYYPNVHWAPAHGGQLRLYGDARYSPSGVTWPVDVEPRADRLLIFDSRIEHEVLTLSASGTKKKKKKKGGGKARAETPPRCAVTQWFQDLAPPLVRSSLAATTDEHGDDQHDAKPQKPKPQKPKPKDDWDEDDEDDAAEDSKDAFTQNRRGTTPLAWSAKLSRSG